MPATTSGAFRAFLTAQLGPGVPVFRDGPRPGQLLPYVVVQEGTSYTPHPAVNGDYGDPARELVVQELVQVDVVQQARQQAAGAAPSGEDYTLAERVMWLCSQPRITGPGTSHVNGVQLQAAHREPIADNVVRHVITVLVTRTLQHL
ncbi:hypothetical protein [Saccharothrix sp. ST-888]|uniref:hypothetical protein n=1 Tax=Saccharothrix sp. ST-888 TaxID=1427391 RepID=UPI0005EC4ADB|nr:hypothetical protein [Saccharothrix sp. ST-888]KJK55644.1 hypothetical protein UK12_27370 [Saccharothrix sp. ST-888]